MSSDIHVLPHAILHEVSVNEIALDQKANPDGTPTLDDPVKFRFGAFTPSLNGKGYIATISFDVLRLEGAQVHRTEVGFLKFACDEMVDGDGDPVPMVEIFLTRKIESTDEAMQRVLTVSRKGTKVWGPLYAMAGIVGGGGGSGASGSFLRAPGGQTELHCQGDGNAVIYDVRPGIIQPEGANDRNGWVPLSTFAGGKIRDFREDGNYR